MAFLDAGGDCPEHQQFHVTETGAFAAVSAQEGHCLNTLFPGGCLGAVDVFAFAGGGKHGQHIPRSKGLYLPGEQVGKGVIIANRS